MSNFDPFVAASAAGRAAHRHSWGGNTIRHISIVGAMPGESGTIDSDPLLGDPEIWPLAGRLLIGSDELYEFQAGLVAAQYAQKRDWAAVDLFGTNPFERSVACESDREFVRTRLTWFCEVLTELTAQDIWQGYWSETATWANEHWNDIADLANMLLVEGRVEGRQLDEWWHNREANWASQTDLTALRSSKTIETPRR